MEGAAFVLALGSLIALYLLGRWNPDCPDPGCKRAHRTHSAQEREERERTFHRINHVTFKSGSCAFCREEKGSGQ